jgi:hypothetical protein
MRVAHRVDSAIRDPRVEFASGAPRETEASPSARTVVAASAVLMFVTLGLIVLTMGGAAHILPIGVRTVVVCLVALTLPGLPLAALLRLPSNGIFASVTISVSIAVHMLLAQLNIAAGLKQAYSFEFVILGVSAIATFFLTRRYLHSGDADEPALVTFGRLAFALGGFVRSISFVLLVGAVALFLVSVATIDTFAAGRFGLTQVLGVDYFLGLGLLSAVLAIEYRCAEINRIALAAANVVLIVYVTMPVAWATRTAPFPTAYAHRFITNWVARLEALPPPVDARMSWAGFFSASVQLMKISGIHDSDAFLVSASLVFSVLMIFPVYAIGLAISGSEKAAWLGATIYVLFNWYQQDYFAPQAAAMQFYATILAVLLWQLRSSDVPALSGGRVTKLVTAWMRTPSRVHGRDFRWTQSVEIVLLIIIAAMIVSHQLTPLVTIIALVLFAATGLTRYKLLWLATVLMFVAWFLYGAYAYWEGHLGEIISDIGGVDSNLNSGVANRISGDPVYGQMQYLRIAASMLLFFTAVWGWFRMPRSPWRPLLFALAVSPFMIVLVQSYGGEVAIRCFLYASPVLAPLAATVVIPALQRASLATHRRWVSGLMTTVVFFTFGVLVVTNRGLNTAFEQTAPETFSISNQLLDQVADADQVAYWGQGLAFTLTRGFVLKPACQNTAETLADCTAAAASISYLVDTKQDETYLEYTYGMKPAEIARAVDLLLTDKGFVLAYEGPEVRVLKRKDAPAVSLRADR